MRDSSEDKWSNKKKKIRFDSEEDLEDLYADDFFWLHERGVDLIFIFSYSHLLRKLYINVFYFINWSKYNKFFRIV